MAQYKSRFGDDDEDNGTWRSYNQRQQRNPFDDDTEEAENNFEDVGQSPEFLRLQREKELLEQRMVDSSYRSVNMINESQQIASDTAQDLHLQREKLERTNRTLDAMQDDLAESDRNITSLKSVWGTMTNWFKKAPSKPPPKTTTSAADDEDYLGGSSTRGDFGAGSGRIDDGDIQRNLRRLDDMEPASSARVGGGGKQQSYSNKQPSSVDAIVDNNLDAMLAGLGDLKTRGLALGNEIDSQNVLLDDIYSKVEKTDARVTAQEGKIRKILKK